tara:strand:+ start:690 stop:1853 length:1164 start_codon:yes stop_codon:yes gene_type:complete
MVSYKGRSLNAADMAAIRRDLSGLTGQEPLVRHSGQKSKAHYRMMQRRALDASGAEGLMSPFGGIGGDVITSPGIPAYWNELDRGNVALIDAVRDQDASGMHINWDDYIVDDVIPFDAWKDHIRGPNLTQWKGGAEIDPRSMAHFLEIMHQTDGILTPQQAWEYAQATFKNKRLGWRGNIRTDKSGRHPNNTPDTALMGLDAKTLLPKKTTSLIGGENLRNFKNVFQNVQTRHGDAAEALEEWPWLKNYLQVDDPPYEGEPSTYSSNFDLERYLPRLAERAEEGQPILAYNAASEADRYRDLGLDVAEIWRDDQSAPDIKNRGLKGELVATANLGDLTAHDLADIIARTDKFKHLSKDAVEDEGLFGYSEPQNAFECGWAVLKQGGV